MVLNFLQRPMKSSLSVFILFMLGLALAGCHADVKTPGATIKGEGFEVDIDGSKHNKHCPPGHAKKGWC